MQFSEPDTREVPAMPRRGLLGHLPQMRDDALGLVERAFREHGDLVRLDLVRPIILMVHPEAVMHVLRTRHANYGRPYFYQRLKRLGGNGLVTNEGPGWLRQRRLASPAFHRRRIASMQSKMLHRARESVDRLGAADGPVDVAAEMIRLTLATAGDTLFSMDFLGTARDVGRAAGEALRIAAEVNNQIIAWPTFIPTARNRRFRHAKRILDDAVTEIIGQRRAGERKDDLLQMFLDAEDSETGGRMDDQQVRDEVITMLLAGHETTANALSWGLMLLARHPSVLESMRVEFAQLGGVADAQTVSRLEQTRQVVNEILRLYPPGWAMYRQALDDDVVMGHRIAGGTNVMLCPWLTHRHPEFWEEPAAFRPSRFAAEASADRHKMAFFPFAAGPRMCIGSNFAMMQLLTVLPTLVSALEFSLAPDFVADPEPTITLMPRGGIPMRVAAAQRRAVS